MNSIKNLPYNNINNNIDNTKYLNKTQITNCILSAPNGVATFSGNTITVKAGLRGLGANGSNPDGTINNAEAFISEDISRDVSEFGNRLHVLLLSKTKETNNWAISGRDYSSQYFEQSEQPTSLDWTWYNPDTREWKTSINGSITDVNIIPLGLFNKTSSSITSLTPFQPVELLKRSDKAEITGWGMPDYNSLISFSPNTNNTAPSAGMLLIVVNNYSEAFGKTYITINGIKLMPQLGGNQGGPVQYTYSLSKGDTYNFTTTSTISTNRYYFIPLKGVN